MQLTIKGGLHFLFFTLSKGIHDAQSFLGYVLSNSSFAFDFLQHHVHIRHRGIMMKSRQL